MGSPGLEKLAGALTQLADKALEEEGLKAADRKALLSAVTKLPWTAPMAYASGLDPAAIDAAASAARDPAGTKDGSAILARELTGGRVIEEPTRRLRRSPPRSPSFPGPSRDRGWLRSSREERASRRPR